ncbi:MAG: hypothetical protein WC076_13975 [Terrimicrobiaceae bacterium]
MPHSSGKSLRPPPHRFSIHARLSYHLAREGWLLLNLAAVKNPSQRVLRENITNNRGIAFREHVVPEGTTRFHGIAAPAGDLEILYTAEVERDIVAATGSRNLPEPTLVDLPARA